MEENRRLLCIEDGPDQLRAMRLLLENRGFVVDSAQSLLAAERLLASQRYAAVLSDFHLPDGHLGEFLEHMPLNPARTIVVSGSLCTAMLPAETHVLPKPVHVPQLVAILEQITHS